MMNKTPLKDILKYFGLSKSMAKTLTQVQIVYLLRKYYSEVKISK